MMLRRKYGADVRYQAENSKLSTILTLKGSSQLAAHSGTGSERNACVMSDAEVLHGKEILGLWLVLYLQYTHNRRPHQGSIHHFILSCNRAIAQEHEGEDPGRLGAFLV